MQKLAMIPSTQGPMLEVFAPPHVTTSRQIRSSPGCASTRQTTFTMRP